MGHDSLAHTTATDIQSLSLLEDLIDARLLCPTAGKAAVGFCANSVVSDAVASAADDTATASVAAYTAATTVIRLSMLLLHPILLHWRSSLGKVDRETISAARAMSIWRCPNGRVWPA